MHNVSDGRAVPSINRCLVYVVRLPYHHDKRVMARSLSNGERKGYDLAQYTVSRSVSLFVEDVRSWAQST